jgi:signal transduction histidine kinase
MRTRLASFRIWFLAAMLVVGLVVLVGARIAIARIEVRHEEAADRLKDTRIAEAIAAKVQAGVDLETLRTIQSVLPNDQIIIDRGGRRIFTGPPITDSEFEVEASFSFRGGRVVVRDYHSPVPGSAAELTLVVGGLVFLVVGAALVAVSLLTRALRQPIDRAAAAADRVAAGDLSARIGEVGPDEFARLARAFDSMAGRLEAVDREQREFLADVAHEIATPVNAVVGLAGALADGTAASRQERAEASELIEGEATRLETLLEDLRRLTRLDLAEPLRIEAIDIADLCRGVWARFKPSAERAGVEFVIDAGHFRVTTDPRLVETVLDNLVSNAIRYTPEGGTVMIRTFQTDHDSVISVADTGVGIAPTDLTRIFDRFYRVDRARDRTTGGSGLGLALARRAAQAIGTHIEVSSKVGRGSEFRVVLPMGRT